MAKVSPIQSSFTGGEFSPLMYGRVDIDRYRTGLATCLNYKPMVQGGLIRRSGTYFVAEVKTSSKETRLVPFEFSTTQAYIIEFGDQYLRFYRNHGQIMSGGSPYEVATPYLEADLFDLKFTQSADVLYIVHPDYAPRKLSRTGHTSWTLATISFLDGPYLSTNTTTTTLTPSAATGSGVTVTASSTTGINDDAGFQATDVGRPLRMREGDVWGWTRITAVASTTSITVDVKSTLTNTNAKDEWRLGVWSDTTGYPAAVSFHENRLFFGGGAENPQRIDGSRSGIYETFSPTLQSDGSVVDSNAVSYTLNSNTVNAIRWLVSTEKSLVVGTTGAVWSVSSSGQSEALTPTNVQARPSVLYGSADLQPAQVGKTVAYVQRAGRKLRELRYFFETDGYDAPDLNLLADHVTVTGVKEMSYQGEPQPLVWVARNDGVLACMTYERTTETLQVGWHRHILGGVSDVNGADPIAESVATIPTPDGTGEETWVLVQRYVDGAAVRYIEYLTPDFRDDVEPEDAFFVDCGLTYDGVATSSVSGLDHLEGETVSVLVDGAVHPDVTVTSGAVTLDYEGEKIHVGYGYNSDGKLLRIEAGARDGTALGKVRRIHEIGLLLHRTLGLKIGMSFDELDEITFRTSADASDNPPALFTGVLEESLDADYDYDNQFCWRQDQPLPGTILAIMPKMVTQPG